MKLQGQRPVAVAVAVNDNAHDNVNESYFAQVQERERRDDASQVKMIWAPSARS